MRAITKNTRRITALTLAAALVVAVYLNWQYARTGIGVDEEVVNVSAVAVEGEPVAAPVTDGLMTELSPKNTGRRGWSWRYTLTGSTGIGVDEEAVWWLWRVSLWRHPLPTADDGG